MPKSSVLISEFFNQFNNGKDFSLNLANNTPNLSHVITEKAKTKQQISFSWTDESNLVYPYTIAVGGNGLLRGLANFPAKGFVVGDLISLWDNNTNSYVFEDRNITTISSEFISFDGAPVVTPPSTFSDAILYGKTLKKSCRFQYNLIENSEPTNFISKIDGLANNAFTASNIDIPGVPLLPVIGVNSWKVEDETVTIKFISQGPREADFAQIFEIEHEFSVLPWYRDGEFSNIQNLIPPLLYSGTNNLKYVFNAAFNVDLSNPNGTINVLSTTNNGNSGWFNQPLDGQVLGYGFTDLEFLETATATLIPQINAREKTTVKYNLTSVNGNLTAGANIIVGISTLSSEADYQQNANTIDKNFLLERVFTAIDDAPVSQGIITNLTVTRVSDNLAEVEYDVLYEIEDRQFNQNKPYVIFNDFQNPAASASNNDRVCLKIAAQQFFYNPDVKNQMFTGPFMFFPHDVDDTDTAKAFDNIVGWLTSGFSLKTVFELNVRDEARAETLKAHFSAYNPTTGDRFDLQTYSFNLSSTTIVPEGLLEYQAIEIDTTRGFKLVAGSQFNKVKVTTLPGYVDKPGIGDFRQYELFVGIKVNFEELILQPGANNIFYNASEPLNGLNKKTSNYSLKEGYEIVVIVEADIREKFEPDTLTNYQFISQPHSYFDFDKDGNVPATFSVEIKTFNEAGVNTSGIINTSENTKIVATFTPDSGSTSLIDPYAIAKINQVGGNIGTIYELSSLRESINNNLLIPLDGEDFTKITDDGNTVVVECLIDGSELNETVDYEIFSELRDSSTIIGLATEDGVLFETEDDDVLIIE